MIPDKALTIHGLMTKPELVLLCRMARSAQSIVELGCFKGRSLAAMGLTNPGAALYGVDWFGDMSHRGYQGSTEAETRANLEAVGVKAELLIGRTDEVAPTFTRTVDLLHIDAGHAYEECSKDLADWVPKVNPGGGLCVHDYGKAHNPKLDRPEVRKAVDDWRNSDWCEIERADTMIAFRHMVADRGVLYVAFGDAAKVQLRESIRTLRLHAPELPVAVVSDGPIPGVDHNIYHVEVDRGARAQKTRMYSLSPFRETLFLDVDTELRSSPEPGFELLKYVDLVMVQDINRTLAENKWQGLSAEELAATKQEIGTGEVLYYNSGVVFFKRNERVRALMQQWHTEWLRWKRHDQLALARAMWQCPVRLAPMRPPWNTHKSGLAEFVFHKHRTASRQGAPR